MRHVIAVSVICGALGALATPAVPIAQRMLQKRTHADAANLIRHYCGSCHSSGRTGVDLDRPLDLVVLRRDRATWQRVKDELRGGRMPPAGYPQPSPLERNFLISWIEGEILATASDPSGRMRARRLSRDEYANAVRDLLGVPRESGRRSPEDAVAWTRVLTPPPLPRTLLETYSAEADRLLDVARAQGLLAVTGPVREFLASFGRRAVRHELRAEELDTLLGAYERARQDGLGLESSVAAALKPLLTSSDFVYFVEQAYDPTQGDTSVTATQLALASRLALFLWSSVPDDELLLQAEHGMLADNLEWNVQRMLRDPRSTALATDFAATWLELHKLGATDGSALYRAMRRETEDFVAHVMQEDHSVLDFLDADYTFLNEPLAQHYGIANVRGEHMRLVGLGGKERGGLLTHASILSLTSEGTSTLPARRGKWVHDNFLGTPVPTPSGALLNAIKAAPRNFEPGTGRQQLERHSADAACARCHIKLDPIGFALENFDSAGAWRTRDLSQQPIDMRVTTADGTSLTGPAELRAYLRGKADPFVRCLGEKLFRHALGRNPAAHERTLLEQLPEIARQDQYRFSRVLLEIVKSDAFQAGWTE